MSKNTEAKTPEDFMRERVRTARREFKVAQDANDVASYRTLSTEIEDAETALIHFMEQRESTDPRPRKLPIRTKKAEGVTGVTPAKPA